jgi:hypothetical protein
MPSFRMLITVCNLVMVAIKAGSSMASIAADFNMVAKLASKGDSMVLLMQEALLVVLVSLGQP